MKYDVKSVILAAGKGTRMKSALPKVLHQIFNKPLVGWVLDALVDVEEKIVVVGHGAELVEKYAKGFPKTTCVLQDKQLGTGHAVSMAMPNLKDFKGTVLITCGDTPLLTKKTLDDFVKFHNEKSAAVTVMTTIFEDPTGYGRIVRDSDDNVLKIVEQKDANETEKALKEVNAGVYCLDWEKVSMAFSELKNDNSQGEYYLTDIISWANACSKKVCACVLDDSDEIFGINSKTHLAIATKIMKNRKLDELMEDGVTIVDPDTTSISPETIIGADTIVFPNTFINGKNVIGSDCKIGPFAHIRGGCTIGNNSKIGNFVELKKAVVGSDTNISHLSYVGDAIVGTGVNIGAGTITANYNSMTKVKSQTIIGSGASIGSNSVLVAPVVLGGNTFVAAGSVITKDVEDNSLAITRCPQKEIKEYVKMRSE